MGVLEQKMDRLHETAENMDERGWPRIEDAPPNQPDRPQFYLFD